MKFVLKDVRCFEGRNEFNIRPITFLVGENSTGKSTVLGCFQALSNFMFSRQGKGMDFNNEPYQMGAFVDIARKMKSYSQTFELGFEDIENIGGVNCYLTLTEREDGSEPVIQQIRWAFEDSHQITIKGNKKKTNKSEGIQIAESGENNFCILLDEDDPNYNYLMQVYDVDFMHFILGKEDKILSSKRKVLKLLETNKENIQRILPEFTLLPRHASLLQDRYFQQGFSYSFAPIRSKPARTYNPFKESVNPEGSEMPMVLMNLSASREENWEVLKKQLENFGKSSGLFSEISVRRLGDSKSDPFQLQITVRGSKANLIDVGYGISQVLPILVRIFISGSARFLLQQPEVHLHPRAQAALSSLLIDICRKQGKSFIIETHSDYMLKRARIEIMQKNIKPEDVSLIYLEPVGDKVEVHNIGFDDQANMLNVPESYGDFFLQERNRFLGFED